MPLVEGDFTERITAAASGTEAKGVRAKRVADLIREETSARWVGIYTVSAGQVVNDAWSGPGPPAYPTFPATQGLTSYAIRTARTVVSNDVASEARYLSNQDDSGSELIVPVLVDERVAGTLDIESERINAFSDRDVMRFEQIASALQSLWSSDD
jgi:L-methionine (R)-S-oxide reductase